MINVKFPVKAIDVTIVDNEGTPILKMMEFALTNNDANTLAKIISYLLNTNEDRILTESLNEELQILDKVKYDGQRGYINGQINGKWIVQVQGSTYLVDPDQLKEYNTKPDIITQPHMKFDDKTQALLFEQYVRCGVYAGNIPIRLNDCYVRYSDFENARSEQQVRILIEGASIFMPKDRIRILENINDFANPDNYVPGVIVDESGEALESILVNAIDYTQAIGDSDPVKIIQKTQEGEQEMQTIPKSKVRTLSV